MKLKLKVKLRPKTRAKTKKLQKWSIRGESSRSGGFLCLHEEASLVVFVLEVWPGVEDNCFSVASTGVSAALLPVCVWCVWCVCVCVCSLCRNPPLHECTHTDLTIPVKMIWEDEEWETSRTRKRSYCIHQLFGWKALHPLDQTQWENVCTGKRVSSRY